MFDVEPNQRMDTTEKLLYLIWKELEKLNADNVKEENKVEKYTCEICNTEYDNIGKRLACLKKHKKEESIDVKVSTTSKGK